jgi:hypothetical protein
MIVQNYDRHWQFLFLIGWHSISSCLSLIICFPFFFQKWGAGATRQEGDSTKQLS